MGLFKKLIQWNKTSGGLYYPEELALQAARSFREKVKMVDGVLAIYEFPAADDGSPVREKGRCLFADGNLIVNLGRGACASSQRLTADTIPPGTYDLGYLGVGNGSGGGATTPQPGDIAMANELTGSALVPAPVPATALILRPLLTVTTPPPGPPYMSNLWTGQIGTADLNTYVIDEAALWCRDNTTLFSYRTFAGQTKSAGFVMEFRWTILF